MIERFKNCRGLRIPLWKGRQLEVWFVPKGEEIKPHIHQQVQSFIVAIWGRQKWTVNEKVRTVFGPFRRRESTKRLTWSAHGIPANVRHGFTALTFSIFLNYERCHGEKVSAAHDFVPVP